jgi:cell volume regulation protein A
MLFLVNRLKLGYEGLYPVLIIALVFLTFGVTDRLGGSGFLAVYLAGIVLGHHDFIHKRSLLRFHDGLAWLMQIAMFLTLGLLVFPSRLVPIGEAPAS